MTNHETGPRQDIDTRIEWDLAYEVRHHADGLTGPTRARYYAEDVQANVLYIGEGTFTVGVKDLHSTRDYRADATTFVQALDIAEQFIRAARVNDAVNDVAVSSDYYGTDHHTFGVDIAKCEYCDAPIGWSLVAHEGPYGNETEGAEWCTPYKRRIRMAGRSASSREHVVERLLCEDCSEAGV